jgi:hypothetical protein
MFDGLSLDDFALFDDGWRPAEVGISGCHVLQALVIALVVVMLDEGLDLAFEVAGQEIVLQQDAVFRVWCQRSILPWVWGCIGAPRTWLMSRALIYWASSSAI